MLRSIACLACLSAFSIPALPATFVLDATDSGWFREDGFNAKQVAPSNVNYFAGFFNQGGPTPTEYRSFFIFDLSSIVGTIQSATLTISNTGPNAGAPMTYNLFEVTSDAATVGAIGPDAAVFTDLGDGDAYGSTTITTNTSTLETITLSAAAIADLIAGGSGLFVIGGVVATPTDLGDHYLFTSDDANSIRQLTITTDSAIPEPASLVLVAGALALTGVWSRLRRS